VQLELDLTRYLGATAILGRLRTPQAQSPQGR